MLTIVNPPPHGPKSLDTLKTIGELLLAILGLYASFKVVVSELQTPWKVALAALMVALVGIWLNRLRKIRAYRLLISTPAKLNITQNEFRGREADVKRIVALIERHQALCLVGDSGCGKSTLINWGILPDVSIAHRHFALKLDSYGSHWVAGPIAGLLRYFQPKAHELEVARDIPTAIAALRREITAAQRPPLLIFDQFDDYLSLSYEALLGENEVIDSAVLRQMNPFWDMILALTETGAIRCIFVFQESSFSLAQAIIAVERKTYRLPLLSVGHARDILRNLLLEAGAPVELPEINELIEHLADDLDDRRGASRLLPVLLDLTLRSLPRLRPFTTKAYRKLGLHGLIALGVRSDVASAAEASGIRSFETTLHILLQMVENREGKLLEKTAMEIASQMPSPVSSDVLEATLEELRARRLTRRALDDPTQPTWTLYHEFLVGVIAQLRAESHQLQAMLQERYGRFRRAGPAKRIWKLLSPVAAAKLLRAHARGYVNVHVAAQFVMISLLFWPTFGALMLAGGITVARQERAKRVGREVAHRLSRSFGDSAPLWLLKTGSKTMKQSALTALVLDEPATFSTRGEVVINSILGLRPAESAEELRAVFDECCWNELQNLDYQRLTACAYLENELGDSRLATWHRYLQARLSTDLLLSLFRNLPVTDQESAIVLLTQAIEGADRPQPAVFAAELLTQVPDFRTRRDFGRLLLKSIGALDYPANLWDLRDFRSAIRPALGDDFEATLTALVTQILRANGQLADEQRGWASEIARLLGEGWRLPENLFDEARTILVEALPQSPSASETLTILSDLRSFREDLKPSELAAAAKAFSSALENCEGYNRWTVEQVGWLFANLDARHAEIALQAYSSRAIPDWEVAEESFVNVGELRALGHRLTQGRRERLVHDYWARLRATNDMQSAAPLFIVLAAIEDGPRAPSVRRRVAFLAQFMRREQPNWAWTSAEHLSPVLRSWWPELNSHEMKLLTDSLRSLYRASLAGEARFYPLDALAETLLEFDIRLPAAESAKTLTRMLHQETLPCDFVAPLVRKETVGLIIEQAFQHPTCPLGVSEAVLTRLERYKIFKVEDIGWKQGSRPRLDRHKLAEWAKMQGYDLTRPMSFKGVRL